jgi:hypothetical protein
MTDLVTALVLFIVPLALIVLVRSKAGAKLQTGNTDILVALVPVLLWLLLTGRIQKLGVAGISVESAIRNAGQAELGKQISEVKAPLPVDAAGVGAKTAVTAIPRLAQEGIQALSFTQGETYDGHVVDQYLRQIPTLRYVTVNKPDGTLLGVVDAKAIGGADAASELSARVRAGNSAALLEQPGYVSASTAATPDEDKLSVLKKMDSLDLATLPVVDARGRFIGVVDRSKLTASILLDIEKKLEEKNP